MKKWWKKNNFLLLIITILCGIMFYWNTQKQGFHEDEIFSYGSSNYKYDNVFRNYGYAQATFDYFWNNCWTGSLSNRLTKSLNYIKDQDSYKNDYNETLSKEIPTWRTKEDAHNYLSIQSSDILNYLSVWLNQSSDVHPPMFYNAMHLTSSIFFNHFTKYIGFMLNIIFFIGTLCGIYQIMIRLTNKKWAYASIIFYGGSMGAISTVMFHRMYMMLTFFSVWYLYYALKFFKKNDKFSKKDKILWGIIIFCGFLTQYYFCIYVVLIFSILFFDYMKKKNWKMIQKVFLNHAIPAFLGILFFPASIYHIFFSYRGLGASQEHTKTLLENILYYLKAILSSYNISLILLIIITITTLFYFLKKKQKITLEKLPLMLCSLPILIFILIVSKIAPFLGENYTSRYIMLLYPIISVTVIYLISNIWKQKYSYLITLTIILLVVGTGLFTNQPTYLYNDYKEALNLAKENATKPFIYIYDNYFTHLNSLPEFATYEKSLIINHNIYDFSLLKKDETLKNQKEVILCIKNWIDKDLMIEKIKTNTHFKNVEQILYLNSDVESTYYRLT